MQADPITILTTHLLLLRQVESQDSTAFLNIFADKEVMHYGDGVKDLAWIEDWIQHTQQHYQQFGYGKWAVIRQADAALLGYCGLEYASDVCGQPEVALGYLLARADWGQGYASEAVTATLNYGFSLLGLRRIIATIDPGNVASVRVAQKAGMVYEQDVIYEGYTHPDHVYTIKSVSIKPL